MKESLLNQLKNIPIQDNYEDYFKNIAKNMFMNYCLKKGDDTFYFTSLEFYFCHNDHFDIITYPRNTSAGQWFFHQSGVDLAFESYYTNKSVFNYKPIVSIEDKYAYGGILIKEVVKKGGSMCLKGPCITMWELFDMIDAFPFDLSKEEGIKVSVKNWPYISKSEGFGNVDPTSLARELRLDDTDDIKKKFNDINKQIFENKISQIRENDFEKSVKKMYRFEISKDYYDYR